MAVANTNARFWLATGAILAGLTVGLGAFGDHGFEKMVSESVADPVKNLGYWETASRYQMYHCLGILAVGFASAVFGSKKIYDVAASLFVVGILLFSGLLYALALTDIKILGAIVPLGGLSMIIGWALFAFGLISGGQNATENLDV